MQIVRPATLADLPAVERVAAASPVGITSLPDDRNALYRRIEASVHAMAADVSFHGEESYFFVMFDSASGQINGVCGVTASAGFNEPFYSYRNETIVHASTELGIVNRVHALSLCHDLTGHSLLTAYQVHPEQAFTAWSDLLSRARFLFIASHRQRFADTVVSEILGPTREDGSSPFWDSVGRRFFGLEYEEAELHCGVHGRTFIAELMPQHPVYVPLLSEEAQAALGQVNPLHEVAFEVLTREGFEADNYIDIFDGGPTLHCPTDAIRTVAASREFRVRLGQQRRGAELLIANQKLGDFRATVSRMALPQRDEITLDPELAQALGVGEGDSVRVSPL